MVDKYNIKQVAVKNCPCCGNTDLHVGPRSCSSYGVECCRCRLEMARNIPYRWPPGVGLKHASGDRNIRRLEVWTLLKAVAAWNRRPRPQKAGLKDQETVHPIRYRNTGK